MHSSAVCTFFRVCLLSLGFVVFYYVFVACMVLAYALLFGFFRLYILLCFTISYVLLFVGSIVYFTPVSVLSMHYQCLLCRVFLFVKI